MKIIAKIGTLTVLFLFAVGTLWAGDVTGGATTTINTLFTYVADTPAKASEVNQNFALIRDAVNDNDSSIDTLNSTVSSLSSSLSSLSSTVSTVTRSATGTLSVNALTSSYTSQGFVTINAPTSGYVLVISSGMIQLTGKTTSGYASIYVGVSNSSTTMSSNTYTRLYLSTDVTGSYEIPFSVHGIFPVSAGSNTFYTLAQETGSSGSGRLYFGRISAIFIRY